MKKLIVFISFILCSFGVQASDQSASSSMTILTALSATSVGTLAFGDVESSASAQTITVAAAASGALTFDITGSDQPLTITATTLTDLDDAGAGVAIPVNTFTYGGNCAGGAGTPSGGSLTNCRVGASADVNANQTSGSYSGTVNINIVYQ